MSSEFGVRSSEFKMGKVIARVGSMLDKWVTV